MNNVHNIQFPNESTSYRNKRNELLEAEIELRTKIEEVARLRRALPYGGLLKHNYIFVDAETEADIHFGDLFKNNKKTLLVYNFMFRPEQEKPCTSCTSIIDGLNGQAPHIKDRINFVVFAKAPANKLKELAESRNWNNIQFLSSKDNSFNTDYFAESTEGNQFPIAHIFVQKDSGIHHFYTSELFYVQSAEGQHMRHVDMIWPMWNIFDLTPEGRGTNWYPKHSYE